jgi:hypothetical protein
MTILQDESGLVVVSPIDFDDQLEQGVRELGQVHTVLAPNRLHYRYLNRARDVFPQARVLGAPGLAQKVRNLRLDEELTSGDLSPQIQTLLIEGAEKLSEVVIFHRPSSTLVVTDLVFNIHEGNALTRFVLKFLSGAYGRVEQSRLCRSLTEDRQRTQKSIAEILQLPIERVVVAHGRVIEEDARTELEEGLWWMRGQSARPSNLGSHSPA